VHNGIPCVSIRLWVSHTVADCMHECMGECEGWNATRIIITKFIRLCQIMHPVVIFPETSYSYCISLSMRLFWRSSQDTFHLASHVLGPGLRAGDTA
jgi:hypothetical protein